MTLLCNCTGAIQRRWQQKNPRCWYKRKYQDFFFVKAAVLFWMRVTWTVALLLCLLGGERQGSVVRPFLALSPLSIVKVDVSELWKLPPPPPRLPHPENKAMKPENAQQKDKSTLSGCTQRCSDGSGWEQPPVPEQDGHRRLLLWPAREHHIRVLQWSAFVSTDKLWLSRLFWNGLYWVSGELVDLYRSCPLNVIRDALVGQKFKPIFNQESAEENPSCKTLITIRTPTHNVACAQSWNRNKQLRRRPAHLIQPHGGKLPPNPWCFVKEIQQKRSCHSCWLQTDCDRGGTESSSSS